MLQVFYVDIAKIDLNILFGYLLSYYLVNKRSLHVRSHGLEILTLIGENR